MGVKIVAVSFGEPEVTKPWVEKEQFPFEVWTDRDHALSSALGAVEAADPSATRPQRVTVILDAQATVVLRYDSVNVVTNPADVLDDVRRLFPRP